MWAVYILLGKKVAASGTGLDALAVGMVAAALGYAPFFASSLPAVLADGRTLAMLAAVGVLASVVPYALDQLVLRRVATGTFAVWTAMLPAVAAIVGAIALHQIPTWLELAGLGLVSVAIAMTAKPQSLTQ
jgi:inner membrane transporter RhtA